MKQTISILVENHAGVLSRISGLFARRGFNIDSLAVGITDDPTVSRVTIVVNGDDYMVEQVEKLQGNIPLRFGRNGFNPIQPGLLVIFHQAAIVAVKMGIGEPACRVQLLTAQLVFRKDILFEQRRGQGAGMDIVAKIDNPDGGSVDDVNQLHLGLAEGVKIGFYGFRIIGQYVDGFLYPHQVDIQPLKRYPRHKDTRRA